MHAQSQKVPLSACVQLRSGRLLQPPFLQGMIGLFDLDEDEPIIDPLMGDPVSSSFGEPYDERLGHRPFSLIAEIAYGTYLPTF
jgi:hypothetical protein